MERNGRKYIPQKISPIQSKQRRETGNSFKRWKNQFWIQPLENNLISMMPEHDDEDDDEKVNDREMGQLQ